MSRIILNEFQDENGIIYNNLRNIKFEEKSDLFNMGKFICETQLPKEEEFNGIYLYQANYDDKKALRIYRNFALYKYLNHNDHILLSELQSRQKYVKLTEFPTGVVTLENYIIGQEIPFYENSITFDKITNIENKTQIINYYREIINILRELLNVEIIYNDIHAKNFIINSIDYTLKLIDFEPFFVYLKKDSYNIKEMITQLKSMINLINKQYNIPINLDKEENLDDIEESILSKKL